MMLLGSSSSEVDASSTLPVGGAACLALAGRFLDVLPFLFASLAGMALTGAAAASASVSAPGVAGVLALLSSSRIGVSDSLATGVCVLLASCALSVGISSSAGCSELAFVSGSSGADLAVGEAVSISGGVVSTPGMRGRVMSMALSISVVLS